MTIHPTAAAFAGAAAEYERGRPDYPAAAVGWLAERLGLRAGRAVLDLAAGTGKLTRQLVATGADVVAVEPIPEMRAELEAAVPQARALAGRAEAIPLPDGAVDAVTVAQAFHWFDPGRALPEVWRVLRPGGGIALVWNGRDPHDPVQAAIDEVLRPLRRAAGLDLHELDPGGQLAKRGLFGAVEERRFTHEQRLARDLVPDRVASTSVVAALPDARRERVLAQVRAIAARAPDPVVLRYVTEVYVADRIP